MARGRTQLDWRAGLVIGLLGSAVLTGLGVMYQSSLALSPSEVAAAEASQVAADASQQAADATADEAAKLPIAFPADRPLRVLFAGDSITVGAYSMTREENFRNLMTAALSAGGEVEPVRIGGSGLATAEVLPEVAGAGAFDVVIVELGTNDVFKSTPEQFRQDYPAFLDAVRGQSPNAAMVCAGLWGDATLPVQGMDATVQQECEARGGRFAPLLSLYQDPANRGPAGTVRPLDGQVLDDFHPNNAGHAAIAAALLGQLAY